jgi:hypothetical protein
MKELINLIAKDHNWNKWVAANSSNTAGCISGAKDGCISIAKQGCISIVRNQAAPKAGCIS